MMWMVMIWVEVVLVMMVIGRMPEASMMLKLVIQMKKDGESWMDEHVNNDDLICVVFEYSVVKELILDKDVDC